jgi:hypothetical protein
MPAPSFFDDFTLDCLSGVHNFSTDPIAWILTNTTPSSSWGQLSDVTGELSTGNGYTAGGLSNQSTVVSLTQTSGTAKLVLADPATWTASGGSFGPFQYVVGFNPNATNDELVCWFTAPSAVTRNDGESYTLDLDGTNGIFTMAPS